MDDLDLRIRSRLIALADAATREPTPSQPMGTVRERSRSRLPSGLLLVVAILVAALILLPHFAPTTGGAPSMSASSSAVATATTSALPSASTETSVPSSPAPASVAGTLLPSGGVSQERAIQLAQQQANPDVQTFVRAEAGAFKDLNLGLGSGAGIAPDRLVWAITLSGTVAVCPPLRRTCEPPRSGTMTYYLDYYTGKYLGGIGSFPAP